MIVRNRQATALILDRAERTIREYCTVIGYDKRGRALYDLEQCAEVLASVPTRARIPRVLDECRELMAG